MVVAKFWLCYTVSLKSVGYFPVGFKCSERIRKLLVRLCIPYNEMNFLPLSLKKALYPISLFFLIALLGSCKKKDQVQSKKSMVVGKWELENATMEEYAGDSLYYILERTSDSIWIEFDNDQLYNVNDPPTKFFLFFATSGNSAYANYTGGGIWEPENNYTNIRLDKNVPELTNATNKNPSLLIITKLTNSELDFTYNLDPTLNRIDTTTQDPTALIFGQAQGQVDGSHGGPGYGTTYNDGYNDGFAAGEEAGFAFATKIETGKAGYWSQFNTAYKNYYRGKYPNYDQGYAQGYNQAVNIGYSEGKNSYLPYQKLTYKYKYSFKKLSQ